MGIAIGGASSIGLFVAVVLAVMGAVGELVAVVAASPVPPCAAPAAPVPVRVHHGMADKCPA